MVENAKIEKLKGDILADFQTLCLSQYPSPVISQKGHEFDLDAVSFLATSDVSFKSLPVVVKHRSTDCADYTDFG